MGGVFEWETFLCLLTLFWSSSELARRGGGRQTVGMEEKKEEWPLIYM